MPHTLTPADLAAYHERGYWISPKLIGNDQIQRLRRAMDRMFLGDYDGDGCAYDNE